MKTGLGQDTRDGLVVKTTDAAILFQPSEGGEFWVPRSVCIDGDMVEEGDEDLVIACWWLENANL